MRVVLAVALLLCSTAVYGQEKVEEADQLEQIVPVPAAGRIIAVGQSTILNGSEFELFQLPKQPGKVTWHVTSAEKVMPIRWFAMAPKSIIVGYKAGNPEPDRYVTPDGPCVAIFAVGSGKASIAAWGIKGDEAVLLATLLVEANHSPQPPPVPPVPPGPNPPPVPPEPPPVPPTPVTSKLLTAVIVEDALQRTPQTAAIIANLGYWKSIEGQVETCHIVPAVSDLAKQYTKQIADAGGVLPVLILMDHATKKVLSSTKLPKDIVELSTLINRFTK